jgi:hypothetical protein
MSSFQTVAPPHLYAVVMSDTDMEEEVPGKKINPVGDTGDHRRRQQLPPGVQKSQQAQALAHGTGGGNGTPNCLSSNNSGDGVYSAILNDRIGRFTIKHLHGDGEADYYPQIGNFYNSNDNRIMLAHQKNLFNQKLNVSFSFNPTLLVCNNCRDRPAHGISGGEQDAPMVFVLSDQCFAPALPAAGDGGCIPILRIENGSVNELAKLFVDVFTGTQLKVGSLILISSVSHLAAVGTAAYAEALVRAAKFLLNSFNGKVTVRPGVPVLLGGVGDMSLMRSLTEVAAWVDSLPLQEQALPNARSAFKLCLTNGSVGKAVQAEKSKLQLPVSLYSFEKRTFVSGHNLQLYSSIRAFDLGAEKLVIDAMIADLNKKHGANLSTQVALDRCEATQQEADSSKAVVIVGLSHANYLATELAAHGYKAITVETKSWRPNSSTVAEAVAELQQKLVTTPNVLAVIYWCLDSAAYYAITDDSVLPPVRDISGHYHIHGALITAPTEMFTKTVKTCLPLFTIETSAKKLVLSPLPRYLQKRCCSDTDHVSNLADDDYETTMFSGLDTLRRVIKDTLFLSGVRDVKTLNTSQLCITTDGARTTGSEVRDALAIIWGDDPVHPARDCYQFLAEHIDQVFLQSNSSSTSGASTPSERPVKRPRWLEDDASSLVTPRNTPHGRGRGGRGRGRGGYRGRGGRGGRVR